MFAEALVFTREITLAAYPILIKLDGGIHGPIEEEAEAESEDEGEFKKEVCEAACECSPCLDKKAVPEVTPTETVPEVVATETVPEVTSQQPKIVVKAARVADKRKGRCVIS